MSAIKQKFLGFLNQIAVDLDLLSEEQSVTILTMQAHFLELAKVGIKPTEKFLDNDPLFIRIRDDWAGLAQEHQIPESKFLWHFAKAASGKGFEKHEAPSSGDIAGALKFIPKDVKNAILTAQAAVRSEQVYFDIMKPDIEPKSAEDIAKQHGRIDYEGKFDPHQLVRAQINNKEADELHLKAKTTEGKTPLDFGQELYQIGKNTANAYRDAATMFRELEIPAAAFISQELERAAQTLERER